MATYTNLSSLFTAIADAIRAKTGKTGEIVADNFPAEIAVIETGVDTSADTVTADTLVEGYTAHNAVGEQLVGKAEDASALAEDIAAQGAIIDQMTVAVEAAAEALEAAAKKRAEDAKAAAEELAAINEELAVQDRLIAQILSVVKALIAGGDSKNTAVLGIAKLGAMMLGTSGGGNADTAKLGVAKLGAMLLGTGGSGNTDTAKLCTAKLGKLKLGV